MGIGEEKLEVAFETILVRQEGEWKIDLDRTTEGMMRAVLGVSMRDIAEEMGRAVGEAMGDAVEGLAEGMQSAGESLAAAAERMKRDR